MTNLDEAVVRLHDIARKIERDYNTTYGDELRAIADLISQTEHKIRRLEYDARD